MMMMMMMMMMIMMIGCMNALFPALGLLPGFFVCRSSTPSFGLFGVLRDDLSPGPTRPPPAVAPSCGVDAAVTG